MKYITGQQVYDEYGLNYQQLASGICEGKIKCYNKDHEEIIDAHKFEEIKEPCYPLEDPYLMYNLSTPNCFLDITTDKILHVTNDYKIKSGKDILTPEIKYIIYDDNHNEIIKVEENSSVSIENGDYIYKEGFIFPKVVNKNFITIIRKNLLDEDIKQLSIPFTCCFYSINNIFQEKFEDHLNFILEKFNKIIKTDYLSYYSDFSYDKEKSIALFFEIAQDFENLIEDIPSKNNFYNYFSKFICKIQYDFLDFVMLNNIDTIQLAEIMNKISSLFNLTNLIHDFLTLEMEKIFCPDGKTNSENKPNSVIKFNELQKLNTSLVEENILECASIEYELVIDDKKFYLTKDDKILACNDSPFKKLQDEFTKEFDRTQEELLNKNLQSNISEIYPVGSSKLEEINNKKQKLIELFEEKKLFQKLFRFNFKGKRYKKDYYYFDINEFLKFYPKEFSEFILDFTYKKNIYSFLFNDSEIMKFRYNLKNVKEYTCHFGEEEIDFIKEIIKFYSHCNSIFINKLIDPEFISLIELQFTETESKYFLADFFVYYNELLLFFKEDIANVKDQIKENEDLYKFIINKKLISSHSALKRDELVKKRISTALSRKRIEPSLIDYYDNNSCDNKIKKLRLDRYKEVFPFLPYKYIKSVNKEKIKEIMQLCENSLQTFNINLDY